MRPLLRASLQSIDAQATTSTALLLFVGRWLRIGERLDPEVSVHRRTSFRERWSVICSLVAMVTALIVLVPGQAHGATMSLQPVADSYVDSRYPDTNYGSNTRLWVDNSPTMRGYLRFDVPEASGSITKAILSVYVSRSSTSLDVRAVTDTTWSESTLTYENAPPTGAVAASSAKVSAGSWASIDVTSLVAGSGPVNLAVTTTSSKSQAFASRESTNAPKLIIERSDSSSPDSSQPVVVDPLADTYVNSNHPNTNYGDASNLWVDGSPVMAAYLLFDVPDTGEPVVKATLSVYPTRSSTAVDVRGVTSTTWSESAMTHENAPATGDVVGNSGEVTPGGRASIDVTSLVTGPGLLSLAVTTADTSSQSIGSRESANPPKLLVEYSNPSTPEPAPEPTTGADFYVDSIGGDDQNEGTSPDLAWKTLAKAGSATMAPGDRLHLKRGSAWTEVLQISSSGTADNPLTVDAYGDGARPRIGGPSTCVDITGSHVVLTGLEVSGCSWAGISVSGDGIRVEDNVVSGNAAGIYVRTGADNNRILRNQVIDNNRMSVLTESPTSDDSGAFGILLRGSGNEVGLNTISGSDAFSYDYGRDGAAVEIYEASRNLIHHNVAVNNDAFTELGGSSSSDNIFAYNMVSSSLDTSVFLVTRGASSSYGPVTRTRAEHNTVRLTGASSQGFVCHAGCSDDILSMRDNVIEAVWKVGYADGPFDEDHGLYFGGAMQFTPGPNSVVADPQFVDPTSGDLRVKATSPALDSAATANYPSDLDGVDVPQDGNEDGVSAPDRGAYERPVSGSEPAPAPDATAPSVSITRPVSGTTYTSAQTVTIMAAATDNVGVTKVEFFDNDVWAGTEDTDPFELTWSVDASQNGTHRWTAKAYDAAGNTKVSPVVDVSVNVAVSSTPPPSGGAITARVETTSVPHSGDAADDSVVWVHPTDPSQSTVIGTDKLGGLAVYDLSGRQLHYYADAEHNNVDIRYNFLLNGARVDLVVSSAKDSDTLRVYTVDRATRGLVHVSARPISVGIGLYGLCMYHSPVSGKYYVFDSDSSGTVQQWELRDAGSGKVDATKVRQWTLSSVTEGCVADDENAFLFIAQEDVAIWRYGAEPAAGTARVEVDGVGDGRLTADVEGLTVYYASDGGGYLIASSQGSNTFAVYDRQAPHTYRGSFKVDAGTVDAVTYTDGIDVLGFGLGPAFPEGIFIAQDDRNDSGNQNYKLVSWGDIARSLGLRIDTTWNPRQIGA